MCTYEILFSIDETTVRDSAAEENDADESHDAQPAEPVSWLAAFFLYHSILVLLMTAGFCVCQF